MGVFAAVVIHGCKARGAAVSPVSELGFACGSEFGQDERGREGWPEPTFLFEGYHLYGGGQALALRRCPLPLNLDDQVFQGIVFTEVAEAQSCTEGQVDHRAGGQGMSAIVNARLANTFDADNRLGERLRSRC